MIKVAFAPSTEVYHNLLSNQIPEFLKDKIGACSSLDEADFIVVWDKVPSHLCDKLSKKKKIFIGAEPPHIFSPNIDESDFFNTFNSSSYKSDFLPAIWWVGRNYNELKSMKFEDVVKSKKISCITTNKWRKRAEFVKFISNHNKELDVFGRWIYSDRDYEFLNGNCYKGPIEGLTGATSKSIGLEPYEYSICLENCKIENYWTEKIIDSILSWTFPIYYGATNLENFFPEDSYIPIDMNKKSLDKIKSIIEQPPTDEQIKALREARRRILDEYNVWVVVYNLIEEKS